MKYAVNFDVSYYVEVDAESEEKAREKFQEHWAKVVDGLHLSHFDDTDTLERMLENYGFNGADEGDCHNVEVAIKR